MKFILILLSIQLGSSYVSGLKCDGQHEIESGYTPVCPAQCNTLHKERCLDLIEKPSCQCIDNYVRDTKTNKCVHVENCTEYDLYESKATLVCDGLNEVYREVVSVCPYTCAHPTGPHCMAMIHKPSCVCANGTIRDTVNNKCVKVEECPQKKAPLLSSLVCNGVNEVYSEVVSACPPTCAHPVGPLCAAIIRKPSCVCMSGTIRDTVNNECVKREECPQKKAFIPTEEKIVCNGLNERYSDWISACPDVCPKVGVPIPRKCMAIINKPSCVCTNGTIRDTVNNKCVRPNECPTHLQKRAALVCDGVNEVYKEVVSACPPTCAHPVGPLCQALIRKPSCVCMSGTIRDTTTNKCVKREECSPKKAILPTEEKVVCNAINEVFSEWISACPSKCPVKAGTPIPEKCLAIIHKPSCVCTNGTIRDTINNRCVTRDHCPQIDYSEVSELKCGQNERLSPTTTCHSSCQRPWIPRCDLAVNEEPECVCISGTIRDSVSAKCVHLKDCPKRTDH